MLNPDNGTTKPKKIRVVRRIVVRGKFCFLIDQRYGIDSPNFHMHFLATTSLYIANGCTPLINRTPIRILGLSFRTQVCTYLDHNRGNCIFSLKMPSFGGCAIFKAVVPPNPGCDAYLDLYSVWTLCGSKWGVLRFSVI